MANSDVDVVVIGGGAAGIAATRRLHEAGVRCRLIEARARLGGRAFTVFCGGYPLDLGCGWLHSADRNPWVAIAESQGRTIDKTPPPWAERPSLPHRFPIEEQEQFIGALNAFFDRVHAAGNRPDRPASELLEPDCRWNGLIGAINTYISGVELPSVSTHDLNNYGATNVNWRIVEGYGTTIVAHAAELPVTLECAAHTIDHRGTRLRVETSCGTLSADQVIITVPTDLIADETLRFLPALPAKIEAARGLPLGLADKLFIALQQADEFPRDSRVFGRTDHVETGAYHLRPFGRPMIEVYLGGRNAARLEKGGDEAFFDFAVAELTGVFGNAFAKRLTPLRIHRWGHDPFARGSYSSALPGHAGDRAKLAAPIDDRLFFAGEACSLRDFSTAHGAYLTGLAAADAVLAARMRRSSP
ncbi:MAG TPA: NAD(P)/FAD-dependent oxidoreductase [Pseudolabrys sp.]|nr:NAD(P)/FAD-dependent oxidoreductase [Pseudolabrys sp.]